MNDIEKRNLNNRFIEAAAAGDLAQVRAFVENTQNPVDIFAHFEGKSNQHNLTDKNALYAAIAGALGKKGQDREAYMQIIEYLQFHGMDINALSASWHTYTPLAGAVGRASHPKPEVAAHARQNIEFLLQLGADPFVNSKSEGRSALDIAIASSPDIALSLFEKHPGRLNADHAIDAAHYHRAEILAAILELRPDLARATHSRRSDRLLIHEALSDCPPYSSNLEKQSAAQDDQLCTIQVILNKDARQINAEGNKNMTPLHLAAGLNHPLVTGELIRQGANVNARDLDGNTPAHIAAKLNSTAAANLKLLVEGGADLTLTNNSGKAVGDVAREVAGADGNEHPTALRILREMGASGAEQGESGFAADVLARRNNSGSARGPA